MTRQPIPKLVLSVKSVLMRKEKTTGSPHSVTVHVVVMSAATGLQKLQDFLQEMLNKRH